MVILNGSDEDVDLMATRLEARVARLKAEKKDKKSKSKLGATATTSAAASSSSKSNGQHKMPFTFKPTLQAGKRELLLDPLGADPNSKKVKKDYSVAADPKATNVYKSIFTSHESEKNQERAHWITYNPHYN